jgi:hypothetical protein
LFQIRLVFQQIREGAERLNLKALRPKSKTLF